MPTNAPGSKLLPGTGSYINVISALTGGITRLNVAEWSADEDIKTGPNKADSGSNGYPIRRITGVDSAINLAIWWDASNTPRDLLFQQWGCGLQLGVSNLAAYQNYGYSSQQFFLLLNGFLKKFKTRAPSTGQDDDIIMADAIVQPNGTRLFLLPDENVEYAAEVTRLQALGQITALSQYATMQ